MKDDCPTKVTNRNESQTSSRPNADYRILRQCRTSKPGTNSISFRYSANHGPTDTWASDKSNPCRSLGVFTVTKDPRCSDRIRPGEFPLALLSVYLDALLRFHGRNRGLVLTTQTPSKTVCTPASSVRVNTPASWYHILPFVFRFFSCHVLAGNGTICGILPSWFSAASHSMSLDNALLSVVVWSWETQRRAA